MAGLPTVDKMSAREEDFTMDFRPLAIARGRGAVRGCQVIAAFDLSLPPLQVAESSARGGLNNRLWPGRGDCAVGMGQPFRSLYRVTATGRPAEWCVHARGGRVGAILGNGF